MQFSRAGEGDDRDSLDILEILLRAGGAHVLSSRTARGALAYLEMAPKLDLVVTDIAMPDMDGAELGRRIRAHSTAGRLPIIAITAFFDLDELCAIAARLARRDERA